MVMPNRRVVELVDTYDSAKKMRERFQGEPVKHVRGRNFGWPRFVRYLGRTKAETYFSNKRNGGGDGSYRFFKHQAVTLHHLFVNDEITQLVNDAGDTVSFAEAGRQMRPPRYSARGKLIPVKFSVRTYEITGPMPAHLSDLAPNKGVQWRGVGGKYMECRLPHSMLAGCVHPIGGEAFDPDADYDPSVNPFAGRVILVIYSREGIHFMITGDKLDVTKDGITY